MKNISEVTQQHFRQDAVGPDVLLMNDHFPRFDPSEVDMTNLRDYDNLTKDLLSYDELSSDIKSRYDDITFSVADPEDTDQHEKRQPERRRKLQNRDSQEMYNLYDDYFEDILRQL